MDNLMKMPPIMLSIPEAAKRTNLSEYYIRRLCHSRKISFVRCGPKYFINYQKLCDFLNAENEE